MPSSELERLSGEDRAILELESAVVAGHTCKVIVLERSGNPGTLLEVLRGRIARRLATAPRLRQRLVPTPLGVAGPVWVDDPRFAIADHVLPLMGESAVEPRQLPDLVARLMRGRLDRSKPLWSLHLADLEGGGAALIWRIHHCMADGTAALRLGAQVLWDSEPNSSQETIAPEWSPRPMPRRSRLLVAGVQDRLHTVAHSRPPLLRAPATGGPKRVIAAIRRDLRPDSDASPFDERRLSADRAVAFTSAPLWDLKRIGRALGGATVNDVLLALITGGLRHWAQVEGYAPVSLRAKVPVSQHDHDRLANRDSFFCIELPLWQADPGNRVRLIHEATSIRKSHHDAEALDAVFHGHSRVPVPLERLLARRADDPRVAALCISNVPGPRAAIFVADARVRELHSIAEIGERHALRVSAISLENRLSLGFCAEPTAVPHLGILVDGVNKELSSLQAVSNGAASDCR